MTLWRQITVQSMNLQCLVRIIQRKYDCVLSVVLSSCGLWPSPEKHPHFRRKLSGDGRYLALDGESPEEWKSHVWRNSGGRGLCVEQRWLLPQVRHLECHSSQLRVSGLVMRNTASKQRQRPCFATFKSHICYKTENSDIKRPNDRKDDRWPGHLIRWLCVSGLSTLMDTRIETSLIIRCFFNYFYKMTLNIDQQQHDCPSVCTSHLGSQ